MENSTLESRCNTLRLELKAWEKTFAFQHAGRKAGRDDIKANPTISLKYKEYNKIRDTLSGKTAPQTPSKRIASRKPASDAENTPKVRQDSLNATPLKRKYDSAVDVTEAETPSKFFSPQGPSMIGPTPQRDGIVLGLFDLLPAETPSKRRAVLADVEPNGLQTPSKSNRKVESVGSFESRGRVEKTPQSVGKRFMLDKFVTPSKRQRIDPGTPTSALKGFSTPAFLRRNTAMDVIDEDHEPTPRPAPWRQRGLGRSLSSMIQSMKKQEDDRLDEEADLMREMEMEAEGIPVPKKTKVPEVLVEDSQAPMPLGPDRGEESESDDNEFEERSGLDRNGNARKVWKKKGLKRQTRRVIMRPNFVKPLPTTVERNDDSEVEEVAETQPNLEQINGGDLSDSDDYGSDYPSDESHSPKKRKIQHKKAEPAAAAKPDNTDKTNTEGAVKTVAKKIAATAHANYQRLKIRSAKGAAGARSKGKFGRRR